MSLTMRKISVKNLIEVLALDKPQRQLDAAFVESEPVGNQKLASSSFLRMVSSRRAGRSESAALQSMSNINCFDFIRGVASA